MSKLGVLAGLGAAGLTYLGLDAAGCIEPVFDYIRNSPGSASDIKLTIDGLATLCGITGVVGATGEIARRAGNAIAEKKDSTGAKFLEAIVDSGLIYALLDNKESRQFVRDNLLYKWDAYSNNLEGSLETIAGLSTLVFGALLVYTIFKGSVEQIDESKE